MAHHIEINVYDPIDPYEKTVPKIFNKAFITDPEWDDENHIWFKYEGKQINAKGDGKKFREDLLK